MPEFAVPRAAFVLRQGRIRGLSLQFSVVEQAALIELAAGDGGQYGAAGLPTRDSEKGAEDMAGR